ncbi:MAG: methylenetetrahydrofolate--tRNA-(uracil(54)-C(5))-methyltransferase (FADH(2)-oxidizing) TrmFO [Bacteroidales bacterium]|nr:methylenetetrahydrofolate--tRNA-(uracil(54)-C(5))-methyltransferase (FADH(2)-oxidizing) TrmFO [Candidatus Latescibacterota bacterium]
MEKIVVVGGGLAGCETALQLASRGLQVELIEMRPGKMTPAHRTGSLAELVCSNSLKSDNAETASGLLKRELRMLGCKLLKIASESRVPAGHALAVDRDVFSGKVGEVVAKESMIELSGREQIDLDIPVGVIATGPLTSDLLSSAVMEHFGKDNLFFYDAISISIAVDSIDHSKVFKASRYGKGAPDYWNVPLDKENYLLLLEYIRKSSKRAGHDFEDGKCFEACLPVEVMVSRGDDVMRYGPLKPRGLVDPVTGEEPYAVIQLRQESIEGTIAGLVGFQTKMTVGAQKGMMALIPGLENAEIVRFGAIHRNTFLDSPYLLDKRQMSSRRDGLFFAGQITGVEGYVESIAHGLITSINIFEYLEGHPPVIFPSETLLGGLQAHLTSQSSRFQPMNANFGILPPISGKRRERKAKKVERSLTKLKSFLDKQSFDMPRST